MRCNRHRLNPRFCGEMLAILFIVLATAGTASADARYTYADLAGRLTDMERLATPVVPGEKTFASTSHDRGGIVRPRNRHVPELERNGDGGGCIRREGDAQVMVDLEGPGVLWRTWSARAGGGHIKIFIDGNEAAVIDKPFFVYLPTNTPHVPNVVAEQYSAPYRGQHDGNPIPDTFYGMIANIDENLGKLGALLREKNLRDNTILI